MFGSFVVVCGVDLLIVSVCCCCFVVVLCSVAVVAICTLSPAYFPGPLNPRDRTTKARSKESSPLVLLALPSRPRRLMCRLFIPPAAPRPPPPTPLVPRREKTTTPFRCEDMAVYQVPITKPKSSSAEWNPSPSTAGGGTADEPPPPRSSNKRPREEEPEPGSGEGGHGGRSAATAGGGAGASLGELLSAGEARRRVDAGDGGGGGGIRGGGSGGAGGGRVAEGGEVGCVCYICEAPSLPGKFDVAKAKALKVPHVRTTTPLHTRELTELRGRVLL